MEQRLFPIGGGSLLCREEGGRVTLEVVRPDDKRGLYKLRIFGRGRGLEMGALTPEQGVLKLGRTISVEKLTAEGCWPVTGAEIVLAVPFGGEDTPAGWTREYDPARLLRGDGLLERSVEGVCHALLRREKGLFRLAVPYGEKTAFALTPLFCLAKVERLGEEDYVVFYFREDGLPMLPV